MSSNPYCLLLIKMRAQKAHWKLSAQQWSWLQLTPSNYALPDPHSLYLFIFFLGYSLESPEKILLISCVEDKDLESVLWLQLGKRAGKLTRKHAL